MTKQEAIKNINALPDDILDKAYHVALIDKRVLCEHNKWLEDKYRDFKASGKPDALGNVFTYFRIGEWM